MENNFHEVLKLFCYQTHDDASAVAWYVLEVGRL